MRSPGRRSKPISASSISRCCGWSASIWERRPRSRRFAEVFDFARDYLGLLKAAVIAAGIVPPGMEGCEQPISDLLEPDGRSGLGLELVSKVNDIPKGSRLAVSTNLLGSLISICMRATGQVSSLTGPLAEDGSPDRRCPGHSGRMAGRFGRRLAGLGRRLARHQAHRRDGGDRGRSGVRHQLAGAVARPIASWERAKSRPKRDRSCRTAWCSSMAAWPRTWGRSWKWSPRSTCSAAKPSGKARQDAMQILDDVVAALRAGDVQTGRQPHDAEFHRAASDDHSLGDESVHRSAHRTIAVPVRGSVLGLLDAGGDGRRRHGLHLRSGVKLQAQDWLAEAMSQTQARDCRAPCRSPWSRSSTTLRSTTVARRPICGPAIRR